MESDEKLSTTERTRKRKLLFCDASPMKTSLKGGIKKQSKSEKSVANLSDAGSAKRLHIADTITSPLVAATLSPKTTSEQDPPYSEVMAVAHALQDEVDVYCSGVEDRDTVKGLQRWCASTTKRLQHKDASTKKEIRESFKRKDVSKSLSQELKKIEDLQRQLRQLKDEDDVSPKSVERRQELNRKAASTRFLDAIDKLRGKGDT